MKNMKNRILHIWEHGITGLLCKHMKDRFGYQSKGLMRAQYVPFNFEGFGLVKAYRESYRKFQARILIEAKNFDLIHIHSVDILIPSLRRLYPKKKIILHYHGSDIRNKWHLKEKSKLFNRADHILVSTDDILPKSYILRVPKVERLHNPIDEGLLDALIEQDQDPFKLDLALHTFKKSNDLARLYANMHRLGLTTHDRIKTPMKHWEYLKLLNTYKTYIDVKTDNQDKIIPAMSRIGLEALYLGLDVIDYKGDLVKGFPHRHTLESVCKRLNEIYVEQLR